ncbi:MAG: pyridoxal-phosphate dependent enzyme [Actinophytocola sp.]|uniref:serine/threonine dehydratase n=1 Tax=Actinophytocola sp. TaxID=1872138 RepID=UPI0013223534|nr:serine/threonine dehydratase [Actinophytocola sp.]MPZ85682.1 pyridoxal-phosphate dependent enzyme [Actinophytocola sp.]
MTTSTILPTPADVGRAAERIAVHIRRTPVLRARIDGLPVVLKLENLQLTGSFKLRGALSALGGGERPEHVVTASGGNHGLAVATAAALLRLPATVYTPESVPLAKARRIEATGATLIRHGATYAEAAAEAMSAASASAAASVEAGARYVPAYNDPLVIAGQGTCAAEAVADAPDVDNLVVAVGGGGLAAGTVLGAGGRPVTAVEPEHCQALHDALAAGRPVDSAVRSVASSALGATRIGDKPFEILRAGPVRSVLVSDAEIIEARNRLWEEFRLAVEPAGAVPFAAWLAGRVPGDLPCLVICGANADWVPA